MNWIKLPQEPEFALLPMRHRQGQLHKEATAVFSFILSVFHLKAIGRKKIKKQILGHSSGLQKKATHLSLKVRVLISPKQVGKSQEGVCSTWCQNHQGYSHPTYRPGGQCSDASLQPRSSFAELGKPVWACTTPRADVSISRKLQNSGKRFPSIKK